MPRPCRRPRIVRASDRIAATPGVVAQDSRTSLIILNLTVAHEFLWFLFPLVGWGAGLTAHYLFRFRWLGAAITDRQARVQQRAATIRRAA